MSKRTGWLLVAAVIAVLGIGFAFLIDKVSVSASSIALTDGGWRANFSSPIRTDAIEQGDLYLTDTDGERIEVEMTLRENGRTLDISDVPPGEYILHISDDALAGSFFKTLDVNELSFTVQEKLQALSSEKELKEYFARLLELQKNEVRYGAFAEESEASSDESSGGAGEGAAADHSTTNNQVEGVDEADLVKTDGDFIYSISETKVVISDVRNPEEMSKAAELTFEQEMYPQQLFLSEGTLVVLGSRYVTAAAEGTVVQEMYPHISMTAVYLYDVSEPMSPKLIREFGIEGNLNGSRLTGGILYFVTNVYPDIWRMQEEADVELRPRTYDSKDGGAFTSLAYDQISILPNTLAGSYSVISAIDLSNPAQNELSTEGFLGGSEQLYMTEETLYLTASAYLPPNENQGNEADLSIWIPQAANTEIFKFQLNGTAVDFVASSEVTGSLLNQFSMDEYEGDFRVVTTEGFAWEEAAPSKNHLFILDEGMKMIGSVEDLAPGERIYSARFMGDKAYMVTFKEVDPLFVIDVADPTAPEVLGELKIPGFSNYLHPLEENHLIGFGYDTRLEPNKGGEPIVVTGGMKISLFDVSDFANPVEKDVAIVGGTGTYSPLQYDHKALFTHKEEDLFGFPVTLYEESPERHLNFQGQGALIYTITTDGIERTASLLEGAEMPYEDWNTSVQRLLYIEDSLFTIANRELKSYDLETFELKDELEY